MKLRALNDNLRMAMDALSLHKLRSALTLVGVAVGVFSIIVVMTAIRVLEHSIESGLSQLGAQTFVIQKWPAIMFGGPRDFEKYRRRKNITLEEGRRLQDRVTLAAHVGLATQLWMGKVSSRYDHTTPTVPLQGVTAGVFPAQNLTAHEGRAFTRADLDLARPICVLGGSLATKLFPFGSAVGDQVKADGVNYTVVGVLASKGEIMGGNEDFFMMIPLTTGLNRYGAIHRSLTIFVQAPNQAHYAATMEQARAAFRVIRKVRPGAEDDFEVFSNDSLISQFRQVTTAVRLGALIVSSIALITAGVGIMNIMLVSVTERTREIGIRRALGAKRRDIIAQFITEAITLCEVGGIAGVVLGIAGGNGAAAFFKVPPVLPWDWAGIGLGVCSLVGLVFGTWPAMKAARVDPIESLRYE